MENAEQNQRVLVVVMNHPRDFQIAKDEGWYRIPLKRAPKQIAADFLAFYHTSAFPDMRWAIHYYAPVKSYRLVTRSELLPTETDHPRVHDLYYKVEIGPLQPLPQPIPSKKLRRITFIPTTWERLLRAREVNELWEGPPSAEKLWQALQSAGIEAEREYEIREGRASYRVDFAIFCQQGKLAIGCEKDWETNGLLLQHWSDILQARGWSLIQLTPRQLQQMDRCLHILQERIAAYGGLRLEPDEDTL